MASWLVARWFLGSELVRGEMTGKTSEVMEQFGDPKRCITLHPGFKEVCLSKHVLEVAALGLKTKSRKSHKTMFLQGQRTEEE